MATDNELPQHYGPSEEKSSTYKMALQQFDEAADVLGLEQGVADYLRLPQRELTVNFPVRMDSGNIRMFTGYRVQHNHRQRASQRRYSLSPAGVPR